MSISEDAVSFPTSNQYQYGILQKVRGRRKSGSESFSSNDNGDKQNTAAENIKLNMSGRGLSVARGEEGAANGSAEDGRQESAPNDSRAKGKRINIMV